MSDLPVAEQGAAVRLELGQLDTTSHQGLRIRSPSRLAAWANTLAQEGQQAPVLVVRRQTVGAPAFTLIDGFARVAALRRLGEDTVLALVLPFDVAGALTFAYGLEQGRRWTAIEEGWLVKELTQQHGLSLVRIASSLARSTSWVSRRLGLVQQLPSSIQARIRSGALSAHAAMRALLPLARANPDVAEHLAEVASKESLSSRDLLTLTESWRQGTSAQRHHIEKHPLAIVRAARHVSITKALPRSQPRPVKDLQALESLARRATRDLCTTSPSPAVAAALLVVWPRVRQALAELAAQLEIDTHDSTAHTGNHTQSA